MEYYGSHISRLIEALNGLPGIGVKSAQRLAFHIVGMPKEQVTNLAEALVSARENVHYCRDCCTLTDEELCPICRSEKRNHRQIMVVENSRDLAAYEKTGRYDGVYHVLQGDVEEVIIATNPSLEGETTATYISKLVKPTGIRVTRIASGVPVGGDIENIDEVTLERALMGRVEL